MVLGYGMAMPKSIILIIFWRPPSDVTDPEWDWASSVWVGRIFDWTEVMYLNLRHTQDECINILVFKLNMLKF